jgi:hypothetical protein
MDINSVHGDQMCVHLRHMHIRMYTLHTYKVCLCTQCAENEHLPAWGQPRRGREPWPRRPRSLWQCRLRGGGGLCGGRERWVELKRRAVVVIVNLKSHYFEQDSVFNNFFITLPKAGVFLRLLKDVCFFNFSTRDSSLSIKLSFFCPPKILDKKCTIPTLGNQSSHLFYVNNNSSSWTPKNIFSALLFYLSLPFAQ